MLICTDCDLEYEVFYTIDDGEHPDQFCPRCGAEHIDDDEE